METYDLDSANPKYNGKFHKLLYHYPRQIREKSIAELDRKIAEREQVRLLKQNTYSLRVINNKINPDSANEILTNLN